MTTLSDEEVIGRYREDGNSRWLDELFGRYHRKTALWCLRLSGGDRESAADLAQEVFLRAYRNLDSFRGDAKFSTWLFMIARNHCINVAKSTRPAEPLEFDLPDSKAPDILASLEQQQSVELVRQLLTEHLEPLEQRVMVMHYSDGLPLETVNRMLGLTNSSGARAYIVSAKRKLARAIERWQARK